MALNEIYGRLFHSVLKRVFRTVKQWFFQSNDPHFTQVQS